MAKYGKKSQSSVKTAMRKFKKGKLKSGKSKKTVTSRKQAIAIGLSEARAKGAKVPSAPKRTASKKKTTRKATARKTTAKRTTAKRRTSTRK